MAVQIRKKRTSEKEQFKRKYIFSPNVKTVEESEESRDRKTRILTNSIRGKRERKNRGNLEMKGRHPKQMIWVLTT